MSEPPAEHATRSAPWSVAETAARLNALILERRMTIFATIDQREAARRVGLELRDTVLIIFGSPLAGTPVMVAHPLAALDLPLKLLVWSDDGQTRVSYLRPEVLAARYDLTAELSRPLAGIEALVEAALTDAGPTEDGA